MKIAGLVVATVVILALGAALGVWGVKLATSVKFDTPYQAVLLDNGQAYFGKIEKLGTPFPVLTDVYYVQQQVNPKLRKSITFLCAAAPSGTRQIAW